jgi:hypothetical protein
MPPIPQTKDKTALRVLNDVYEAASNRPKSKRLYLGMSEIGEPCDRALWYSFRGFPSIPIDGRVIMLFRFGDLVEQEVVYHLKKAGYDVTDQQLSFKAHDGNFRGHCDGIVHGITDMPHILEVKSCNKKAFDSFRNAGVQVTQPKYYCQCQCYMGFSGLERALVAVQCKDDSSLYFERIYFSRTDFEMLSKRAFNIITANDIPPQTFGQDSLNCQWCRHRTICYYPEETIVDHQVCGTCKYFAFKGLGKWCRHPGHVVEIVQWGIGCPDWVELDSKDPQFPKAATLTP